jgi:hypothetical protein
MGVDDLLVQGLHRRDGVGVQHAVLLDQQGEIGPGQGIEIGTRARAQAVGLRSLVRRFYNTRHVLIPLRRGGRARFRSLSMHHACLLLALGRGSLWME